MKPLTHRYFINLSRLILFTLALFSSMPKAAGLLQPFEADYRVYRNGQYVANADFSLQHSNNVWIWSMKSAPRGVYSWLTRKRPYSETHMLDNDGQLQLAVEISGDYPTRSANRAIWFDHQKQIGYYSDNKKQRQIAFNAPLYNYHSIHLLYRQMKLRNESVQDILFYKKGKLYPCKLTLETGIEIQFEGASIKVDRLTQLFTGSKRLLRYDYQGHPLAPLRIEQVKGDNHSVMERDRLSSTS